LSQQIGLEFEILDPKKTAWCLKLRMKGALVTASADAAGKVGTRDRKGNLEVI